MTLAIVSFAPSDRAIPPTPNAANAADKSKPKHDDKMEHTHPNHSTTLIIATKIELDGIGTESRDNTRVSSRVTKYTSTMHSTI